MNNFAITFKHLLEKENDSFSRNMKKDSSSDDKNVDTIETPQKLNLKELLELTSPTIKKYGQNSFTKVSQLNDGILSYAFNGEDAKSETDVINQIFLTDFKEKFKVRLIAISPTEILINIY